MTEWTHKRMQIRAALAAEAAGFDVNFEVAAPTRDEGATHPRRVDYIEYRDGSPWLVVEFKRVIKTRGELATAVEQAEDYQRLFNAPFAMVVAAYLRDDFHHWLACDGVPVLHLDEFFARFAKTRQVAA